ncbi:FkbM family methyltransferase [Haloarcula sediminis]|uniref:FkbM family methyltransferase n=1 Tax=Haloarcula sediminis TaxID=3111777 RepID=UPI002D7A276E|nr:FkbM family methyltransferase [Haloarcula sp. CK38]
MGETFKYAYFSRVAFINAKNVISDGKTSEGIGLDRFDLNPEPYAVFDVGAHHGIYSVILGVLNPSAKLYVYEPASAPRKHLVHNLELNNLRADAMISHNPVTGVSGESIPFKEDSRPGSEQHGVVDKLDTDVSMKSSVALSDVFRDEKINTAWLKIDAEGQEGAIVDDLVTQDTTNSLAGIIELHPEKLSNEYYIEGIIDTLSQNGFDVEFLCESAPNYNHDRPIYYFEN